MREEHSLRGANAPDPDLLRAANINPVTGLATDYLNHFNEVAMMVGMLSDMPELADAVLEWEPLDYAGHFHTTGFRERELAILAYETANPVIRQRFETMKAEVEEAILSVQDRIRLGPEAATDAALASAHLFELIAAVGGVINANKTETNPNPVQSEVDSLFD